MRPLGRIDLTRPVNWSHPLNRGRVVWWLALPQWSGGNTWHDLCRRNNGTLTNGPTWRATTRPGGWGGLSLDGSNDRVPAGQPHRLTDNFSMGVWLNPTTLPQNEAIVVYNGDDSGGYGIVVGVAANTSDVGALFGGIAWYNSGFTLPTALTWYRVWLVRSAGTAMMYVNGVQTPTTNNSHTPNVPTLSKFEIGHEPDQAARFFSGRVDDVTLYNRPLSASEIILDYDLSRRGYPGVLNRVRRSVYLPLISTTVAAITDLEVDLFHTADAEVALTHTADDAVDLASVSDFEVALE